jgi:uncharacterized protein YjbI with pentapeptide repeats
MTVFENQELIDQNFDNQNLQNFVFNNVTLTKCSFVNTNLKNCTFTNTNLKNSKFLDNNLTNLKSSNVSSKEITQMGQDITGEAVNDQSGKSVSINSDGTRVAIGASFNDGTASNAGHTRVFEWDGISWNKMGDDIDGEAVNDLSGNSVSISGDGTRVAIGASFNDGTASNAGHTRVFEWDGISWNKMGDDIDGEAVNDQSGKSVSINSDGTRVAIGAYLNDGTASNAGHARVFEWDGISWNKMGDDIDGEVANDQSGNPVSISGDGTRVAIGASFNDGTASDAGHTRVFEWDGISWNKMGDDIDGEAANDRSGNSVSISGDGTRVAIGAYLNDASDGTVTNAGHTRVFEWDGISWNKMGDDIDGEAVNDWSGKSVSINSDGTRIIVGGIYSKGNGISRVFEWDGISWNQIGKDLKGSNFEDLFGMSVSMSVDGKHVAIGAVRNDDAGSNAGHTKVFDIDALLLNNFKVLDGYMVGSGVDMSNVQVKDVVFDGDNLSEINFSKTSFKNVKFIENDFTNTIFSGATFEDSEIVSPVNLTGLALPVRGLYQSIIMNEDNSGNTYEIESNLSIFDDGYDDNYSNKRNYFNIFKNDKLIQIQGTIKTESNFDFFGIFKGEHSNITYSGKKFYSDGEEIPGDQTIYSGSGDTTLTETYLTGSFTIAFCSDLSFTGSGYEIQVKADFDAGTTDFVTFFNSLNLPSETTVSSSVFNDSFITKDNTKVILPSTTPSYTPTIEEAVFAIMNTDGDSVTFNLPNEETLTIRRDTLTDYSVFKNDETDPLSTHTTGDTSSFGDFEWKIGSVLAQLNLPFGVICFGPTEMVETDQGMIPIQEIHASKHTIRGEPVTQKTNIRCLDDKVILIEKDALGKDYPTKDTIVSLNHQIFLDNKYVRARHIKRDGVHRIDSNNRELYNIMLPKYTHMKVNNMIVETLHPNRRLK